MALISIVALLPRHLPAALATAVLPVLAAAQSTAGSWDAQFETARQLADRGALREAQTIFETATDVTDARTRAYGFFGRAFVMQQRFAKGDTAETPIAVDSVVAGYARADLLDPTGIGIAAHNNAATLLRAVGRHDEAADQFIAAAVAGAHPDRATFFLNAAIELAARTVPTASSRDSAMWAVREAMRLAPRRADVLSTYSQLLAETLPVAALLDSLAPWTTDTLRAQFAANAISSLLVRADPAVSETEATRGLVAFAEALPVLQISPATFDAKYRGRIEAMSRLHPSTSEGASSLLDAMSQGSTPNFRPGNSARWWMSGSTSSEASRAAWSSVLRWMGDWYFQQGRTQLAQQFYEGALGGNASIDAQWVDRRALVPLGLIYVEAGDKASSAKLQHDVKQFTDILFSGKASAYARGDVQQIRDFHLALATIYAKKGQWTSDGPDNAEYQIEHLRQATATLERQTGRRENISPDLLANLAVHYQQTGKRAEAESVKKDIRAQFSRQGRTDAGEQVIKKIDTDSQKPDALKAETISPIDKPKLVGVIPVPNATQPKRPIVLSTRPTNSLAGKTVPKQDVPAGQIAVDSPAPLKPDSGKKLGPNKADSLHAILMKAGKVARQAPVSVKISVLNAAGQPLPGVDVQVDVHGKRAIVRTGSDGTFTLTIPPNIPDIAISVVNHKERFSGRVKVASSIEIKLAPR